mmetsp:Transcript_8660/g.25203  ORF Transcript_8660/g.25203 Transcript_8660/m.25203 type:complete len:232 (+) Transcript_8660:755-1450(+)
MGHVVIYYLADVLIILGYGYGHHVALPSWTSTRPRWASGSSTCTSTVKLYSWRYGNPRRTFLLSSMAPYTTRSSVVSGRVSTSRSRGMASTLMERCAPKMLSRRLRKLPGLNTGSTLQKASYPASSRLANSIGEVRMQLFSKNSTGLQRCSTPRAPSSTCISMPSTSTLMTDGQRRCSISSSSRRTSGTRSRRRCEPAYAASSSERPPKFASTLYLGRGTWMVALSEPTAA